MTSLWQARPIFITSTFRDFHAERDHLRNVVFPALEERLRTRRHHLEPIDLRWGVETTGEDEAQAKEMLVLKVCLAEVERSRPFLIGLLGDRYGWIPPKERMAAAAQEAGFVGDVADRSVTDLEIDFGVLSRAEQQSRCFFYFREPLPYQDMPPEVAADYSECFGSGGERAQAHIEQLKQRIENVLPERVRHYTAQWNQENNTVTGLEQWGQQVLEDLWTELDKETATFAAVTPSWQEQERYLLEEFIEDRARHFIGREGLINELIDFAIFCDQPALPPGEGWGEGGRVQDTWGMSIEAATGAGKSALFAKLQRELSKQDVILLSHAAGISPQASNLDSMLVRWVEELAMHLDIPVPTYDEAKLEELEQTFQRLLHQASTKNRVILLVDALNQFEASPHAQHLTWLPNLWPENVRFIATAIPGIQTEVLGKRPGVKAQILLPLGKDEAEAIVSSICARYRRTLNPEVLRALTSKRAYENELACGNPLWLTLAVEELNLLDADDFARAEKQFPGTPEQKLYQLLLSTATELPPTVPELYGRMLERAEELHGKPWADGFASLIAVSRFGWREQDFERLIPRLTNESWDALTFATLRRTFRGQIVQCGGEGQWDFAHTQLREAALTKLLSNEQDRKQYHQLLVNYLLHLPKEDPVHETETMVHLIQADDKARAAYYYGSPLTDAETTWATQALAVFICTDNTEDVAITWVCSLLEVQDLEADIRHRLATRYTNFYLHDALVNLAVLGVRLRLTEAVIASIKALTNEFPNIVNYQRSLAIAYERLGEIYSDQDKHEEALAAYTNSHKIFQHVVDQDQDDIIDWKRDLLISHEKLGDLYSVYGKKDEARTAYRAQLEIAEYLNSRVKNNPDLQRDYAITLGRIANIDLNDGNVDEALATCLIGHTICQRLGAQEPMNAERQNSLSVSYMRLGDIYSEKKELNNAHKAYEEALSIVERFSRLEPDNVSWQQNLSSLQGRLGNIYRARGEREEALSHYIASLSIAKRLVEQDPTNLKWQKDLSSSYDDVGYIYSSMGVYDRALPMLKAVHKITEQLATRDPDNLEWQRKLSTSYCNIGNMLRELGNLDEALSVYHTSLAIRERIIAQDSNNVQEQMELAILQGSIGDVCRAQGKSDYALTAYHAAIHIAEHHISQDPNQVNWQRNLAISRERLGDAYRALGKATEAFDAYRASLVIRQHFSEPDPKNTEWQHGIMVLQERLGHLYTDQGNLGDAYTAYISALDITERLAAQEPSNSEWQRNLASLFYNLSNNHQWRGDAEKCSEYRQKCFYVLSSMQQQGLPLDTQVSRLYELLNMETLLTTYVNQANVLIEKENLDDALTQLKKGQHAAIELLKQIEPDQQLQRKCFEAVNTLGHLSDIFFETGTMEKAITARRLWVTFTKEITNCRNTVPAWHQTLYIGYRELGVALMVSGKLLESLDCYQASREIVERLLEKDKDKISLQQELEALHQLTGDTNLSLSKFDEALKSYRKLLQLANVLAERFPDSAEAKRGLAMAYYKIALLYEQMNDLVQTKEYAKLCHSVIMRMERSSMEIDPELSEISRNIELEFAGE